MRWQIYIGILYIFKNGDYMSNLQKIIKRENIYLYILLFFMILFISFVIVKNKKNPKEIIESKLNLKLSDSVGIVYFEHDIFDGFEYIDSVYAKLKISEEDKIDIISQLEKNVLPEFKGNSSFEYMPNFDNLYDWFSITEDSIVYLYCSYRTDIKFKDKGIHNIWLIISAESNGYYLYIAL